MNTTKYRILKAGALLTAVTLVGWYAVGVSYGQHMHTMQGNMQMQGGMHMMGDQPKTAEEGPSLQMIHSQQLPAVQQAVERAIQHLQAGHQQQALAELQQIKTSLATIHQTLGKLVGPAFVNDHCPIMGGKIDATKVSAELTRMLGQDKVAFCCAACPAQWDRLTEAEKTAKLQKVAAEPQAMQHQIPHQP